MGRPVNKKFFADPASAGYQIACQANFGAGAVSAWIVSQRSNSVYVVTDGISTASLTLVQGAPAAAGQMQVPVTPVTGGGDALAAAQDETAFSTFAGGTGYAALDTITLSNGDVVTVDTVSGGVVTEFTVTTVGGTASVGEVLTQASSSAAGDGFTLTVEAENLDFTFGAAESARIINQHTVKTFEGNIYNWPEGQAVGRTTAAIGS